MKLIDSKWNPHLYKYENTWLANTADELTADFDPDSAEGSIVMVISNGNTYIKNASGKWQKMGSTEVIE